MQALETTFADSDLKLKATLQETALCFILSLNTNRSMAEMLSLAKIKVSDFPL